MTSTASAHASRPISSLLVTLVAERFGGVRSRSVLPRSPLGRTTRPLPTSPALTPAGPSLWPSAYHLTSSVALGRPPRTR